MVLFFTLSVIFGVVLTFLTPEYGLILIVGAISIVFLVKRQWLLYTIVFSLFLEGYAFSFYFWGMRIRGIQLLEIIGVFCLLIGTLMFKIRLKKTPIDLPLLSYILINFLALINAVWITRSIKIAILLFSLGLLYYLIYNLITTKKIFDKSFNLLLYVGLVEIIYGLYQVFAGAVNYYLDANLPIGYLGVVHSEYIASPWGRPYGTFVEPDWYGAICLFYSISFISLYHSKLKERKRFYLLGMILSLIGLFFSFVRASWIGFVVGILALILFKNKSKLLKFNLSLFLRNTFIFFIFFVVVILFQPIRNILKERFYPTDITAGFNLENVRFRAVETSFKFFLYSPIIGNGPGSGAYNYFVEEYGEEYAREIVKNIAFLGGGEGFNPSIIVTVFEDTGLVGFIIFLWLIGRIILYNIKKIPVISEKYQLISLSLFSGLIGLFASYLFTQGFWIPFTWVFIGFNMAALRIGELTKNEDYNN
jgi:O-antigen ligase